MDKLKFLTPEQKKCWNDNGYVKLTNVFTLKEMTEICDEYDDIFQRKSHANLEGTWTGDDMKNLSEHRKVTIKSIHALQMHSGVFTRLITNPNLLDALEDIMDTKDIILHHTKAHIKPPEQGAPYLMHQDYPYFPHKKHSMLAVFLHLDDTTPENGGLAIYPGSHRLGPLPTRKSVDGNNEPIYYVDNDRYPLSGATPVSALKGEIIVFSYLTLHGSYLNLSKRTRRMFLIQVRAGDDEHVEDVHKSPCQGLVLRGKNPFRSGQYADRYNH